MKKINALLLTLICFTTYSIGLSQEAETPKEEGYQFKTIKNIKASPVKDQYKSGTCWSFAATSYLESELIRLGYDTLDISEMYFVNYTYREKANRYVRMHGNTNFSPGGQAHDVLNVVKSHGFATESEYPGLLKGEQKHIHGELDAVLKGYLSALVKKEDGKLSSVWPEAYNAILNAYLGPVNEMSAGYDKTPSKELYPRFNPDDYVELTSYNHHPYYETFDLEIPDNWSHDLYYNLPLDEFLEVMNSAVKNGYTVCWDGDVSDKGFSHSNGVAIVPDKNVATLDGTERSRWEKLTEKEKTGELYSFKKPGTEKTITQEMRQEAFNSLQSTDDHLMHITGMVTDQNGTVYYTTKNSWAASSNKFGGYLNMSESYVRLNTIAIMVHKDAIPQAIRRKLKI
jgi:bleomycin hydrolase